jgi:hypothetical protein
MRTGNWVSLVLCIGLILFNTNLYAFSAADHKLAAKYFDEITAFCKKSDATLWPVKACRPTVFVEPASRSAMLNSIDPDKKFTNAGEIFIGQLPLNLPVANTSIVWGEQKITMLIWPLPTEQRARLALFAHESFHGIQSDLGLTASGATNAHLDDEQARVMLRLEWRALAKALLASDGKSRRAALQAALSFREKRFAQFSTAAKEEAAMEAHEGLAEYTGIALAYEADARSQAVAQLGRGEKSPALSRSFAYFSGPAYGLLLDATGTQWRREIAKAPDLAMMLKRVARIETVASLTDELLAEYGGVEIRADEQKRAELQAKRIADIRARFVDGPTLKLPLKNMQFEMNPQNIFNMPDGSQYHETLKVRDEWGEIQIMQGAFIVAWKELRVSAPSTMPSFTGSIEAESWRLTLRPDWWLVKNGAGYQAEQTERQSVKQ